MIAVIGSRNFRNEAFLNEVLEKAFKDGDSLISGGAKGADSLAEAWCRARGIPVQIILPDWQKHGRAAGFIRNEAIVAPADLVIAFWVNRSRGTGDSLLKAQKLGKRVQIHDFQT